MRIGIFSKFECAGGSEFRCVELSNGINRFTDHTPVLLSKGKLPSKVLERLDLEIEHHTDSTKNPELFYALDCLVTINTDSKEFTTLDYWKSFLDISRLPKCMAFLFNFIVSPARHLIDLVEFTDVRIITTNKRFYDEIGKKEKHIPIRSIPRTILESPIDPDSVTGIHNDHDKVCIGKHSKGVSNKWNEDHAKLIQALNDKYPDQLMWDFMGGSRSFKDSVKDIDNVILRPEFTLPVSIYLSGLDIFLFYPSWSRQEPWCRVTGEAMMSGLPINATDSDGGNRMQIVHECNGFLSKDFDQMCDHLSTLIEDKQLRLRMGRNSKIFAQNFKTESIIYRLLNFLKL